MTNPIRPEFELFQDFIPVLFTSKFDEDPIKNERASLETPFSHYKSLGNFSDAQERLTMYGVVRSGRNSNSSTILCLSSLPTTLKKEINLIKKKKKKKERKGGDIDFPIIRTLFVAMETRVLIQSVPKPYATFSPP